MISRGQDVDDIELITDVKSDNVIEQKSTKLSLLLQLFLIAVSLLMLEIKEVLDLINSTLFPFIVLIFLCRERCRRW